MAEFFIVPTSREFANYQQDVSLDGVTFRFLFRFNSRDDAWYLSILDVDDNPLRSSLKLVRRTPRFRLWQFETRPDGELFVAPIETLTAPPGLDELGSEGKAILVYFGES